MLNDGEQNLRKIIYKRLRRTPESEPANYDQELFLSIRNIIKDVLIEYKDADLLSIASALALDIAELSKLEETAIFKLSDLSVHEGKQARELTKISDQRTKAGFSSGSIRKQERLQDWQDWQFRAEKLWCINPRLSKKQVANLVAAQRARNENPDTIRKRISRQSN
ncbi:hypothetical protein [Thiopseudomonas alkaliphila]|uniref:hypothetical protein n=1 Tax=Thiopseudomonas alkaliphila TaxID=1697053 RepID=UPI0025758EA6|nr:hypothetical protein [Thiopseudomonas alkaliphila]MDM1707695.1 hypothetical protein [Thiopseudomonas alkaliphila]